MDKRLKQLAEASGFGHFILGTILLAAVLVGLETYSSISTRYHSILFVLEQTVLWIFVVEALIKIGAEGKKPWIYFMDPWNVFDFAIVVVCFLPIDSSFAAVLRLARILRTLRLVSALPKLQILVGALLKSIPSMGYVSILLFILFYVYAVMGTFMFRGNDPMLFQNVHTSSLTLFRVVTLEDWTDVMYTQMYGSDVYGYDDETKARFPERKSQATPVTSVAFFVSFVLFGTMVMLNLGMDEAREEADAMLKRRRQIEEKGKPRDTHLVDHFVDIEEKMAALAVAVAQIREHSLAQEEYRLKYAQKLQELAKKAGG
ncbi:MAG: ion transporter [Planctomycetota bacterium]|jgi:voltage-gated sodium channel